MQIPRHLATLELTDRIAKNYQIKSQISQGGFGEVYIGKHTQSDEEVIIKKTPNHFYLNGIDSLTMIIDTMACINKLKNSPHENIINFYDSGIDFQTKDFYEIMEYCKEDHVRAGIIPQDEAIEIIYQVANGLAELHKHNITHRDIKPENILIKTTGEKKIYKIADFGFACLKDVMKSNIGTLPYLAPDMMAGENFTNKIDIWALGITFHLLLFNFYPFPVNNFELFFKKIKNDPYIYPDQQATQKGVHPYIKHILENMLKKIPEERYSAKDVINAINQMRSLKSQLNSAEFLQASSQSEWPQYFCTEKSSQQIKLCSFGKIDKPITLSTLKMNDWVCFAGRGLIKMNNSNDQIYFSMDCSGTVHKIDSNSNAVIANMKFDVGGADDCCSIILNKSESCLLISGRNNSSIYAVNPKNLEIIKIWKYTNSKNLNRIIFLDNETFCAGYRGGLLKVFNIANEKELSNFNSRYITITSFEIEEGSKELLVGDGDGRLFSIMWDSLDKVNWEVMYHSNLLSYIFKSSRYIMTGSYDKTIILMNSLTPPQPLQKIETGFDVIQLYLTPEDKNLLVLCDSKFILFKNKNEEFEKTFERAKKDFHDRRLQSFIVLNNRYAVVGNLGGFLYSMTLLEQSQRITVKINYYVIPIGILFFLKLVLKLVYMFIEKFSKYYLEPGYFLNQFYKLCFKISYNSYTSIAVGQITNLIQIIFFSKIWYFFVIQIGFFMFRILYCIPDKYTVCIFLASNFILFATLSFNSFFFLGFIQIDKKKSDKAKS